LIGERVARRLLQDISLRADKDDPDSREPFVVFQAASDLPGWFSAGDGVEVRSGLPNRSSRLFQAGGLSAERKSALSSFAAAARVREPERVKTSSFPFLEGSRGMFSVRAAQEGNGNARAGVPTRRGRRGRRRSPRSPPLSLRGAVLGCRGRAFGKNCKNKTV
jgi:hypothetical protein